ncbi:serine/threonine protein kinase [Yoonia sediminilitoris]|uniref:Non-specific serine/threonine protein kinase n=1 Tax=Yoonia sediminilitoris TaxID=1286148 RepID=A0A2T6KMV5_9RHOB|nr:serine/threonine-protein kinase [Yoonia sediminilitoris]PUB17555.1 non-specific serine/threonine protein kinase [Yoonia sediminilitoris]RCW97850.1 non-specific serine/threonine protein kinase [Yoonia sediminilitoris]
MGKAQIQDNSGDEKDSFVDELKPGTKLMHGQYTIENFLNAGGFGITYLAKDSLDRKIVIKECFPGAFCRRSRYVVQARSRAHQNELKSIVRLFVQEARSLAKLDHPNIVGVHQVFEDNETAYMALDYVEGRDLLDTIEDPNHGLTPVQIKSILKEVLGAVGFIHDQGILHRDISPDNILINKSFHPVLIDFGAAREEATKQSRVLSALRVVKDGYSPQEFYIAGSEQSPSSDLYALAASFHHLIARNVPPNSQARLAAIASGDPDPYVPLLGRFDEYENDFLAAIDKALAVLPKDRLKSAQDWVNMMDGVEGNVTALNVVNTAAAAATDSRGQVAKKSKAPLFLGSAAAIALLIGVGAFFMTNGGDVPLQTPFATPTEAPQAPAPVETPAATVVAPVTPEAEVAIVAPQETTPAPELATPSADQTEAVEPETVTPEAEVIAPEIIAPEAAETIEPEAAETQVPAQVPVIGPEIIEDGDATASAQPDDRPGIIEGPAIVDPPDLRPATRPQAIELSAVPEVVAPNPLPEPVVTPRNITADDTQSVALPNQTVIRPATDNATPNVALPGTPEAIADLGTGEGIEGISAVTPGNELLPSAVQTSWSVRLPFGANGADSNTIGFIAAISPVWVKPGLEITAVNGTPVASISEISEVLRETVTPGELSQIEVSFGTLDPATSQVEEHQWAVPVVQETTLLNGARFETVAVGDKWRTTLVDVPAEMGDELFVGDVLEEYIPTGEAINGPGSIGTLIERELENGTTQFPFKVGRDGNLWLGFLNYAGRGE